MRSHPLDALFARLLPLVQDNLPWWRDAVKRWAGNPPHHIDDDGFEAGVVLIPFRQRLTPDERIALLAAIHDNHARGGDRIDPWSDSNDEENLPERGPRNPYSVLLGDRIPKLSENWNDCGALVERFLDEVERELSNHDSAQNSTNDAQGIYSENERQKCFNRAVAKFHQLIAFEAKNIDNVLSPHTVGTEQPETIFQRLARSAGDVADAMMEFDAKHANYARELQARGVKWSGTNPFCEQHEKQVSDCVSCALNALPAGIASSCKRIRTHEGRGWDDSARVARDEINNKVRRFYAEQRELFEASRNAAQCRVPGRHGESTAPAFDRDTIIATMSNAWRGALSAYDFACAKTGNRLTDPAAHAWLAENGAEGYRLPCLATFTSYLTKARRRLGEQKNTPRADRTGRSIVKANQI